MKPTRHNKPRNLIPLPAGDIPVGYRCVSVHIPDGDEYEEELAGLLNLATMWLNYERDATHKGTLVAQAWLAALRENTLFDRCAMPTEIRVDDICTLSWSYDDWTTFDSYDPSSCILANIDGYVPGLINDIIDGLIADGTLQRGGGQPGPEEPPIVGTCKTYHVILRGNDRWKIPSPLSTNDSVQVSNAVGGWTDGALKWYCPAGTVYFLGGCTGDEPYEEGDPIESGNHMRIIVGYNEITPAYGDCMDTAFLVPEGVEDVEAWIQANDSTLYDNNGQVEFDVVICTGGWCHRFDFTTDDFDFLGTYGETYSAGNGWYHGASYPDSIYIYSPLFDEVELTSVTIELSVPMAGGRNLWRYKVNGTNADTSPNYTVADGSATEKEWVTSQIAATRVAIGIEKSVANTPSYDGYIVAITLRGTGVSPFGADNC